jgi:hypothetical protein
MEGNNQPMGQPQPMMMQPMGQQQMYGQPQTQYGQPQTQYGQPQPMMTNNQQMMTNNQPMMGQQTVVVQQTANIQNLPVERQIDREVAGIMCCFCFDARTGTLILTALTIIGSLVGGISQFQYWWNWIDLVVGVMGFYGAFKYRVVWIYPYLIFLALGGILCIIWFFIFLILILAVIPQWAWLIAIFVPLLIYGLLAIWWSVSVGKYCNAIRAVHTRNGTNACIL